MQGVSILVGHGENSPISSFRTAANVSDAVSLGRVLTNDDQLGYLRGRFANRACRRCATKQTFASRFRKIGSAPTFQCWSRTVDLAVDEHRLKLAAARLGDEGSGLRALQVRT